MTPTLFPPFTPSTPPPYTPISGPASPAALATPAPQANPLDEKRPILGGIIDLGPSTDGLGCGSKGTTGVPDRFFGLDLLPACINHDARSDPLFERSHKSLGYVLETQARFFGDIVAAGGDSFLGKVGATLVAIPYTAAVTTVALGQYAVNRVIDGVEAIGSFFGSLF